MIKCFIFHTQKDREIQYISHHHHHHQSLNREGRWGTTDDFAISFLHFSLFSTALWDLPNSRPVHSLMLSSHLFLCLPCFLLPFTVPCKMVLARPDERETWPYHCSLCFFMIVKRSSCSPIACWILAWTSLLVTWSLYEMCSILWKHIISLFFVFFFGALLWGSMIHKHTGRWMWQGSVSVCLGAERNTPVIPNWFQPRQCGCCLCYPGKYLGLTSFKTYLAWVLRLC